MSIETHSLAARFAHVRSLTEQLAAPLSAEDCQAQSMTDASPVKWHLAHTTWFWETFLLKPHSPRYRPAEPAYEYLFNSYYEAVGPRHPRPERGLLTRPGLEAVMEWRHRVTESMREVLDRPDLAPLIELGLAHEQQHQELILTDILDLFRRHPLAPAYAPRRPEPPPAPTAPPLPPFAHPGGVVEIGHGLPGFAFDNEGPRHRVALAPFTLAANPVGNAEYQGFVEEGGYRDARLWLSDGWAIVRTEGWSQPVHWRPGGMMMSLNGLIPRHPEAPVCHLSYYEADAFARWRGKRLPTEAEWETAAAAQPVAGNFLDSGALTPISPAEATLFGNVWAWTQSAYAPYPGYRPGAGALGEYNGKFMCNQMVLRGGSCCTPAGHVRATYRNFFYPAARWQFSGLRLVEEP